ncbi:hypothetical protein J4Q44_G00130750 [Coregonus suidteri]|uniref:Uncharacterized protein n=1 Tax=Coregonus suidteri TaxID=861788 RepID=A0AAN8M2A3_9TELE
MMYCADNHLKRETGFTIFRLLTKAGVWVQANARVVFKAGRPDFIVVRQKALTNQEGEEHLRQKRIQLPFNFATGEALLYESCSSLGTAIMPPGPPIPQGLTPPGSSPEDKPLEPASLLGPLLCQDCSVYTQPQDPNPSLDLQDFSPDLDLAFPQEQDPGLERPFLDSHALLSVPRELQGPQRPSRGDPTAQAMMDSLGEILGNQGFNGGNGSHSENQWQMAGPHMTYKLNSYEEQRLLGN